MLIDSLLFAATGNSNYLGYTRHTSSCLGVAGVQAAESHSVSMFIDSLLFAPTGNLNYLGHMC
jgi:hypothetical protein